jgi:hypothetical protein
MSNTVCDSDILEGDGRTTETIKCFQTMKDNRLEETHTLIGFNGDSVSNFVSDTKSDLRISPDYQQRSAMKLEKRADTAKDHDVAIGYYSSALSLHPTNIYCQMLQSTNI